MPKITERPIAERMEMIKLLFSTEASRVGRVLVVKEELMRCLLLYECPENFQQLKRDIKIGCANAYVRELANPAGNSAIWQCAGGNRGVNTGE